MIVAGSASPLLLASAGGYNLTRSLRFRSSASAFLNRTPASAGNRRAWTWSGWVKRGALGSAQTLFSASTGGTNPRSVLYFISDNTLVFGDNPSGSTWYEVYSTAVYRDPSAWYHVVAVWDSSNATSGDRIRLYINGVRLTSFSTASYPPLNTDSVTNTAIQHFIGQYAGGSGGNFLDGYLTEVNFIDGQALTPSSFGANSPTTGAWQPKKYVGTYGTNGFYLPFTNNSTTTTLGNDFSGNGNNWTTNNISLTAGATYDSMTDVPTLTSATAANYCVLNPLQTTNSASAPTNANLTSPANAGAWRRIGGSMQLPTTGKFYFEYTCDSFSTFATFSIGVFSGALFTTSEAIGFSATEWGYNGQSGYASNNNSNISSGFTTATTGDVLQLAYDANTGSIWFGKNNTWQGASSPNPSTGTSPTYTGVYNVSPVMVQNWATQSVNFGQRPFAYTPPTGFNRLNTFNLPTPTIGATASTLANKYFDISLYTGNGGTQTVTNAGGFSPDLVWIKPRAAAVSHSLYDTNRGAFKALASNTTDAEIDYNPYGVSAFNSNGFTVVDIANGGYRVNGSPGGAFSGSSAAYVGWQWRGSDSAAVTNTAGTITSTVSANTSAGFSVVTYTGTGVDATVGHGLGVAPAMMIVKNRSGTNFWIVQHQALTGITYNLYLNAIDAQQNDNQFTAKSSTTVSIRGAATSVNGSGNNYVMYAFAAVLGYSAFGSYTGNGSADGTFVYTGFRPRYVMIKRADAAEDWVVYDTARNPSNLTNLILYPNISIAEATGVTGVLDIVSNGFKLRGTSTAINTSGGTYIYMAFAETPLNFALAR